MGETELSRHGYNHMIVWLDHNIASPDEYRNMKKAFTTTTNPESVLQTSLNDRDITNLINDEETKRDTSFFDVPFPFKLFDKSNECLRYLTQHAGKKRVFFITSSQLGENIVKNIVNNHPEIFKDNTGKFFEDSIYIFCGDANYAAGWAIDYLELNCIKIENDEYAFLARFTRDIAKYLTSQGEQELSNDDLPAVKLALQYFEWAKCLYENAEKIKPIYKFDDPRNPLKKVIQLINQAEDKIRELQLPQDDEEKD